MAVNGIPIAQHPSLPGVWYQFVIKYLDHENEICAQRPHGSAWSVHTVDDGMDKIKRFKTTFPTASSRFQHENSLRDFGISINMVVMLEHHATGRFYTITTGDYVTADMLKKAFANKGSDNVARIGVQGFTNGDDPVNMDFVFVEINSERFIQSIQLSFPFDAYKASALRARRSAFMSLRDFSTAMCKDAGVEM